MSAQNIAMLFIPHVINAIQKRKEVKLAQKDNESGVGEVPKLGHALVDDILSGVGQGTKTSLAGTSGLLTVPFAPELFGVESGTPEAFVAYILYGVISLGLFLYRSKG